MNILEKYLKHLSRKTESMFPIDSISSGKPFQMPVDKKRPKLKRKISIIGQ
jgi:hypothetical protein